jgi:predicted ATPase/DNA-binding winged helix-turn-helix (wHTH) protein
MTSYRFGDGPVFELQVRERRLLADGKAVPLGSRALDILVVLAQRSGQVVRRSELIERVWGPVAVEENNLNVQISALRKVLGARLIATIPGRGYCFTPVTQASTAPAPAQAPERFKTNLPATLTPLIGRAADLAQLDALIASHRLVTILGPGGIGKTLLAQHLLRRHEARHRHGVCFVELSALPDAAAIPGAIASALNIQPASGTPLAGLCHAIETLDLLVVLDNAEHLLDGAAQVALALHDSVPGLRLVVTSQAPLKLAAERLHRVGALAVPQAPLPAEQALAFGAIALFVDRAQAADSRFALTDDSAAAAIELCRALDGLPLAIELAAWRAPTLGVRRLLDSMHAPLQLLATSNLGVPKRLQTLRNALEWSHGLLDPREQTVLRRLSVLVGSSDLDLIQKLACDPPGEGPIDEWAVVDALTTLVDRSLITVVPGLNASVRYRLLESPKAFAKEQLVRAGEAALLARRHAQAMVDRFERAYQDHCSGRTPVGDWRERHLPDVDNGHEALAWLHAHHQQALLTTLLPGLLLATPREELAKHARMMALSVELATSAPASPHTFCTLLEASVQITYLDAQRGLALASAALRMANECAPHWPDHRWRYAALCQRALTLLTTALAQDGQACLAEARALEQASWPAVVRMRRFLAEVWLADRRDDGQAMYEASLTFESLAREAGVPGWANGLCLVNGALAAGQADDAVRYGLAVVAQLEGTRHCGGLADTRVQLVGALIECHRLDEARAQSQAAWPLLKHLARVDAWADYQTLLAALEGLPADAARLMGYANGICARDHIVRTRNEAAAVQRATGIMLASLGEFEMNRLVAQGEGLLDEDIPAIAFAVRT